MKKQEKLLHKILSSASDANIPFEGACHLLESLEFRRRARGTSHMIFTKARIHGLINVQNKKGKVKPYQVKQIREFLIKYKLVEE